jgi:hypothetical protein
MATSTLVFHCHKSFPSRALLQYMALDDVNLSQIGNCMIDNDDGIPHN